MSDPALPWLLFVCFGAATLAFILAGWLRDMMVNRQRQRRLRERFSESGKALQAKVAMTEGAR